MKKLLMISMFACLTIGCTGGYEPSAPCGQYGEACFYKVAINQ